MKNRWMLLFFDIAFITGLISCIALFYFEIKNIFLTYYIIIMSIILLILKLQYFYINKNLKYKLEKESVLFQRLTIFLFVYIAPAYCLVQEPYIIVNRYISFITLIIVTILAIIGLLMDLRLRWKFHQKIL